MRLKRITHVVLPVDLNFLHASEQYKTLSQFFAHDLRQVMSRPQVLQGFLGKVCLFPLNVSFLFMHVFMN
jgi:hypothetical protein